MGEFGKRTRAGEPSRHTVTVRRQGEPRRDTTTVWQQPQSMPKDLISKRDLKAIEKGRAPTWANMSRTQLMASLVLVPLLCLAAILFYGPDLARDLRHAGQFAVAADLQATDGKCKRHAFLVTLCSADIRSERTGQVVATSSFLMFFRSGDGAELVAVRSSANASVISIRYAVSDVLLNRTLSLLGVAVFFGWVWWMFFDCLRKGRYKGGPAHEALAQYLADRPQPA
jgi:hypothetical protein